MKVLSILQPWASLCVTTNPFTNRAIKTIETRSWATKLRGEILIHASCGKQYKKIPSDDSFYKFLYMHFAKSVIEPIDKLPTGAIIGKVTIEDVIQFTGFEYENMVVERNGKTWSFSNEEFAFGDYSAERYGWLLSNPVLFDTPIPAKGKLGIWEFNGDLP